MHASHGGAPPLHLALGTVCSLLGWARALLRHSRAPRASTTGFPLPKGSKR